MSFGTLALCGLALFLSTPAARAAPPPPGFFGVGAWTYPDGAQSNMLGTAGLRLFRGSLGWNEIQPTAGSTYNWQSPDALATHAAQDGYDIVFALNGCAVWACGAIQRPPTGSTLDGTNGYLAFVREAVKRYAPDSTFWNGKPRVPKISWQVWNEVNGGTDWPNPTPADYASFLVKVSQTIKSADDTATVLMSGLDEFPGESTGVPLTEFLNGLYQQPDFARSFDVAAVHAYAADPAGAVHVLDEAHRVMVEHGDGSRPLWVTEMSWASGGPAHPFTVPPATQNAYLRQTWGQMLACHSRWNLDHVLWFALQDVPFATLGFPADYWGVHNGLLNADGTKKPAYQSFLEFLGPNPPVGGGQAQCPLPGGDILDITDPNTTIVATPGFTNNTQHQPIAFSSNETEPGVHFECSPDGSPWQGCTSPFEAANGREGDHEIRIRAFDAQGNVDPTPATGRWQLDLSPPRTSLTARPPSRTTRRTLSLSFTGRDAYAVAGFQCRVDGGAWKLCVSPYTTPPLGLGAHTVDVRAFDVAGNLERKPAQTNVTITNLAPPAFRITTKTVTIARKKRTGKLAFSCASPGDDACALVGTLKRHPVTHAQRVARRKPVVGTIKGSVVGGKTARVTITLNSTGRKLLGSKKGSKLRLDLTGKVKGRTGLKTTAVGLIRLRRG